MIKKYIFKSLLTCLLATAFAACDRNEWTVDGRIEGADGQTMFVEASDNGRWYPIDSVKLDESGKFKVSHRASGFPDIYRLRLDNKTLYFPIDSIETVTVVSNANAFDSDYELSGSPAAKMLMSVDRRVLDAVARGGAASLAADTMLKRELGSMLLGDPSGIVSYYIINKKIGGVQIFSPDNQGDLKIIGAVANAYTQYRPNDPRTTYLKNLYLSNRRVSADAPRDTIHAREVNVFDIKLFDNRGAEQSLAALAAKGGVVVLNFTAYGAEESPAFNRELNKVYEKYHSRGLEIFQVSLDQDEYLWKNAAANLPWITVLNSSTEGARNLNNYNVTDLPTTFVIDRNGDIVARVTDIARLDAEVASRL